MGRTRLSGGPRRATATRWSGPPAARRRGTTSTSWQHPFERPAFELHYPHMIERTRAESHIGRLATVGEDTGVFGPRTRTETDLVRPSDPGAAPAAGCLRGSQAWRAVLRGPRADDAAARRREGLPGGRRGSRPAGCVLSHPVCPKRGRRPHRHSVDSSTAALRHIHWMEPEAAQRIAGNAGAGGLLQAWISPPSGWAVSGLARRRRPRGA